METTASCRRIVRLCRALGRGLGLESAQAGNLGRAAALHDVGKTVVPARVLTKPGPLNEGEWALMRRHTIDGARILEAERAPRQAMLVALCHHERWDGSGYPFGLKTTDIPLFARIVALADVYDALRSPRVYKSAWSRRESVRFIAKRRGTWFEPLVVDCFLHLSPADATFH